MCASVRPKRTVKITATPKVVSIMASMDEEARHSFTQRANLAVDKKEAVRQEKKIQQLGQDRKDNQRMHHKTLERKQQNKGMSYWLFSASFAEIFKKLIMGH